MWWHISVLPGRGRRTAVSGQLGLCRERPYLKKRKYKYTKTTHSLYTIKAPFGKLFVFGDITQWQSRYPGICMTLGAVTSTEKQKSKAKYDGILVIPAFGRWLQEDQEGKVICITSSQPARLPETLSLRKFAGQIQT